MSKMPNHGYRGAVVVLLVVSGMLFGVGLSPATADVTTVTGNAYGYWTQVSLFGGPATDRGPEPAVQLGADAANSPQTASVDEAAAVYGPAVIFRSKRIDVRAEGSLGAGGSVTASARVQANLEVEPGEPRERPGPLYYDTIESTCTADENGIRASTTITNGVVVTSYNAETQYPASSEPVPVNPEPGHTVEGTIDHVGDRFRIVYNEQINNPDGTLTVNAAHMYLLGDIAVGHLIIGQSTCGVTAVPGEPPPPEPPAEPEAPEPPAEPEPPEPDEDTATATVPPAETDTPGTLATAPTGGDDDGGVPTGAVLAAGLVLVAIIGGVLLARRRGSTGGA